MLKLHVKKMTIIDFIKAINSSNEETGVYTGVSVIEMEINSLTNEGKEIRTVSTAGVSVEIEQHNNFYQLNITFPRSGDNTLRLMHMALNDYGKRITNIMEEYKNTDLAKEIWLPTLNCILSPSSLADTGYIIASAPVFWAVQPSVPGSNNLNMLCVVFPLENLSMEMESVDLEQAIAEVDREMKEQEKKEFMEQEEYYNNIKRRQNEKDSFFN